MDTIQALEMLENLTENDWNTIKTLISDHDPDVRLRTSELLALFPSDESEQFLLAMLHDSDYLVRASVCDSLSFSKSIETLYVLFHSAKDKSCMVRGYAVLSIGDIQRNIGSDPDEAVAFLKNMEQTEPSEWVRIAIFRSLFILGQLSYGDKLLNGIESRYYKNRYFALTQLEELLESDMVSKNAKLKLHLQRRLEKESAYSVKQKLNRLLELLLEI